MSSALEKKELPHFQRWFDLEVTKRPDCSIIRKELAYFGLLANLDDWDSEMIEMSSVPGELGSEDPLFIARQKAWDQVYRKVYLTRSYLFQLYGIPIPMYVDEVIMPDKYRWGVLLSTEDFKKYCVQPRGGDGKFVMEADTPDKYKAEANDYVEEGGDSEEEYELEKVHPEEDEFLKKAIERENERETIRLNVEKATAERDEQLEQAKHFETIRAEEELERSLRFERLDGDDIFRNEYEQEVFEGLRRRNNTEVFRDVCCEV